MRLLNCAAISLWLICLLLGYCHGFQANNFVANNFVEEALKGLNLVKMSNYLVDYNHLHGEQMLIKPQKHTTDDNLSNHLSYTVPAMVFPSPYPKELYDLAWELQQPMAEIHLRASLDYNFLKEATKGVIKSDEFMREMVNIMDFVEKEGRRQSGITLILQRSDYLTHKLPGKPAELKQIEVTSGTNAGQGTGQLMTGVHQRVLEKVQHMKDNLPEYIAGAKVVENKSAHMQAQALYKAWKHFGDPKAIVLLISAPKRRAHSHFELLLFGQFELEDIAWPKGDRPHLEQITIQECTKKLHLDENFDLRINDLTDPSIDGRRVAVAVFLDGYLPEHFPTKADWHMRKQMERSSAIMQPNVHVQLMSTKKVQQVLAEPGVLEQFYPEIPGKRDAKQCEETLAKLRGTFIEMWALGTEDEKRDIQLIKKAISSPNNFVLKANLEAGKGNYFNRKMKRKLKWLLNPANAEERKAFILQKRIKPFWIRNASIPQPPDPETAITFDKFDSEVSIFGSLIAIGGYGADVEIDLNTEDGYMIRTKRTNKAMCTLSSLQGGSDSIVLFEQEKFALN